MAKVAEQQLPVAQGDPLCCAGAPNGPGPAGVPWPPMIPGRTMYGLRGPQVEPQAGFWTINPCAVPCIVRISDLIVKTDDPANPCFFPDYPTDPDVLLGESRSRIRTAIRSRSSSRGHAESRPM